MKGDQSMSNLLLGLTGVKKFVRKARTSSANRRMKEEASSVGLGVWAFLNCDWRIFCRQKCRLCL